MSDDSDITLTEDEPNGNLADIVRNTGGTEPVIVADTADAEIQAETHMETQVQTQAQTEIQAESCLKDVEFVHGDGRVLEDEQRTDWETEGLLKFSDFLEQERKS